MVKKNEKGIDKVNRCELISCKIKALSVFSHLAECLQMKTLLLNDHDDGSFHYIKKKGNNRDDPSKTIIVIYGNQTMTS